MTETLSHIALRRLNGLESSSWYTPLQGIKVTTNADDCLVIDAPKLCDTPIVTNDMAEIREISTSEGKNVLAFRIIGRRDNVINSGGVKIQMEELERLIRPFLTMPYMVTKCKSEKFGEIVVLMVEKEGDDEGATVEEKSELPILQAIHRLLHRALPRYWEPRLYLSVDRIPMTETGKPNRALAQRMAEKPDLTCSRVFAVDDE